ncbi:TAXI family TRAP transporter solute-binding subunit [Bacillus piscicola]|uniref:TAXI family TRAP transporter solute-binding subunit n=1 Tax=Bacillus piscicola TaxID=1632684 RepID=UPI001F09B5A8|nr:TAXI family TRAP transporter solute-binding subunit [Bacillus piscicola]
MLTAVISAAFILTACGNDGGQSTEEGSAGAAGSSFITIATGGTSGVYYPIGGAIAKILEGAEVADTSVQATGASVENINLLSTNRAELATVMSDSALQAYEGSGAFEEEEPREDLTAIGNLYPNYVQVIAPADSGIESVADLKGKTVGVGAAASGTELNARLILDAYGLSYDDIEEDYLSFAESVDQMKNGMVDAAFINSGIPNSAVIDFSTQHDVKILPIEGEEMQYLLDSYPFFQEGVIEAGMYENEEDVNTAMIQNILMVKSSLSEEEVYNITKTLFDNLDSLHSAHNAAKNITVEGAAENVVIPIHEGAKKYYEEEGVLE